MMQSGKLNFRTLNEPTKTKAGRWEGWIQKEKRGPQPTPWQVFSSSRPHSLYLDEACGAAYRQPARKYPGSAGEDGHGACVHAHTYAGAHGPVRIHVQVGKSLRRKKPGEMTVSKARCPERKQKKMKGRPPHPSSTSGSFRGGRAPDGYHLWRPGCRGRRDTGTTWPGRHVESRASDPEAAISAHDLIARWAPSRSLKNRKSI